MQHAPLHARVNYFSAMQQKTLDRAYNLSLEQWGKIDLDLFCPIAPGTKVAQ